ncbi:MAG: primosomal protein N', partial [Pseudomonadota bacterium]
MALGEAEFFPAESLVAVWTVEPLDRTLDYKAPEGGVRVGAYVVVPLGPRKVLGIVWGAGAGGWDPAKIRRVIGVLDVPPMGPAMRGFLVKAAEYTLTPMPMMIRLATRAPGLMDPPGSRKVLRLTDKRPDRVTEARQRVVRFLEDHGGMAFAAGELAEFAGVSGSVLKGLQDQGVLQVEAAPRDGPFPRLDPRLPGKDLSDGQRAAAVKLREAVASATYGTTLLKGVTGSGKTEVYLEAVAACLAAGRQALVLLPEIALTAEFMARVEARFGAQAAEWHSGVTMANRRRAWKAAATGEGQLFVGARSALFLPFARLGLVVVDEEHDGSYKQEEGAIYHARDMAVLRAHGCGAQVVLASATPSLETWANADAGKYARIDLTERFGDAVLPEMGTIDLRAEDLPRDRWITESLAREVEARLAAGEQSLLFLNRRGYAPVTVCRACGTQIGCDHCDARMVEHRFIAR